jgi:hypothetical protein
MTIKIFTFLLMTCLISCKKEEVPVNKFVGIWHDTQYIVPGSSSIKINKDSTFVYTSAACTWQGFSRGKWKMTGDSIELNSSKIDSCYSIFPFLNCNFFNESKIPQMTIANCEADNNQSFVLILKEKFYIKNDSLVLKIKSSSKCPATLKIVFARTQKVRK